MIDPPVRTALNDIGRNLELCLEFLQGLDFVSFQGRVDVQYSVIRALEVVGEASKRIPESFRTAHPAIPWRSMAGMRDRLIHGYDDINLELVYRTVRQTVPDILKAVRPLMDS